VTGSLAPDVGHTGQLRSFLKADLAGDQARGRGRAKSGH
jgi:hypothetical protein